MNYDRYSREEFDKRGHGTDAACDLAIQLQTEVLADLYKVIEPRMREIASELIKRGHDLTEDAKNYPECLCFREIGEDKERVPGLILAVDLIISTGYPHTLSREDLTRIDD